MSKTESGVSEVVGAILLVSIFVGAAGIFMATQISDIQVEPLPKINFETNLTPDQNSVYFFHKGGDVLYEGEFEFKINGQNKGYTPPLSDGRFNSGDVIYVDVSSEPHEFDILLIYKPEEEVIFSRTFYK